MTTLADLAKDYGVTPQAVAKWRDSAVTTYGDLNYQQVGKRKEYDEDAVEKILKFRPAPTEPDVQTGNHRVTGQLAVVPNAADLGVFRGDVELTTFDNPLEAVNQALSFADGLLGAMDKDTAYQMTQIQQTQQANATLRSKLDELERRKAQYQTESKVMSMLQGKEAAELQQNMIDLKAMGIQGD
ncbi:hypothetical protein D0962_26460 [Leptolyngbyaceae cyanobacterium CCMR0082]|uniref:Uncharacterized protein n=1 Tax=Adonisia turfae CCMR0082 TaxID=2304604 RepID=A0A6M0SDX7_9CYAN|nr:hypothetical protein [Adonisia turfae]NEZ66263.1 hypothetical protein [Adonisia turfae CCMR0082]